MKKNIAYVEGTVACVLRKRQNELDLTSLPRAKASLTALLESPEIRDQALARQYIYDIQHVRNMPHLLSILGTYMTGVKVG